MTFFIRFEHKFLRNIYSNEEIKQLPQICRLKKYKIYQRFIKISVSLLSIFGSNMNQDEDQFVLDLKDSMQEKYREIDLEELKSKIDDVEIKNIVKKQMVTRSRNLISNYMRLYMMQCLIFLNQVLCTILSQLLIFLEMC